MKRFFRFVAAVMALAASIVPAAVFAQQTESRITGRVLDDSKAAMPGVTVTVTSKSTGAVRTAVTGGDGRIRVTNLGPGTYTVAFELSGFANQSRDVVLGVGQFETVDVTMGVATLQEAVTVSAESNVIDISSARIGVNVSPEEVDNLPVNGRNFANLMTLATGATSDGNGGWASVRFNGKSNQQNYLNYDGVDGTYVWDASPGYLNSTGSQFRLQTSMESVAEFRVNSGLAPAESGLGAGGNITVVSKSGTNAFHGSLFEYKRDDALDSASKYDDKKQQLELDQFGGSFGGPIASNRTFFFGSFEALRQKTGLSFTEAVPSDEARRRILAGEPVGTGGGQSAARTQAVAPLLPASRRARRRRRQSAARARHAEHDGEAGREQPVAARRSPLERLAVLLRAVSLQRRRPRHARSHRDAAPRARQAASAERRLQLSVADGPQRRQRVQGGLQQADDERAGVRRRRRIRSGRRVAVRHGHLVID